MISMNQDSSHHQDDHILREDHNFTFISSTASGGDQDHSLSIGSMGLDRFTYHEWLDYLLGKCRYTSPMDSVGITTNV